MKPLWAPWRMEFLLDAKQSTACPFCTLPAQKNDLENLILHRNSQCYVIMNRYPYNSGHLLVIPFRHESEFEKLTAPENHDLATTLQLAVAALRRALKPDGINIGMNLGHAAGAGIPGHLHYHVIPRWIGDTNFLPILGDTKVMNEYLAETYQRLLTAFS